MNYEVTFGEYAEWKTYYVWIRNRLYAIYVPDYASAIKLLKNIGCYPTASATTEI